MFLICRVTAAATTNLVSLNKKTEGTCFFLVLDIILELYKKRVSMNSVRLSESWITCSMENFLTREKGVQNILKSNLKET